MSHSRLKVLLIALGLFNVLDYLFTLCALRSGFLEGNPFMAPVVTTGWFFVIKVVLIPAALCLIWSQRSRLGTVANASVLLCTGVYLGLMGYFGVLVGSGMMTW